MSLKDNFNQAVKEILRKDGLVGEELSKESKKKSELDKYIDPPKSAEKFEQPASSSSEQTVFGENDTASSDFTERSAEPAFKAAEPQQRPAEYMNTGSNPFASQPQTESPFAAKPAYENPSRSAPAGGFQPQGSDPFARMGYGGGNIPPAPPINPGANAYMGKGNDTPYYETEETTIISRNTIVNGSIRSFANVTVDGSIKGDVKITKNISVTGKIVGDIECNNSVMAGASMQGNVASKGQVQIDRDTILLGDISAQYLDLNGKIKGNLDIGGKAEFKTDAVVLGNITASTITVLDGATIQGYVNTTFLQESSAGIFPESIAVTE